MSRFERDPVDRDLAAPQVSSPRELTILFTDVERSTELRSRRGDRVADEILGIHETIVRSQIEQHGGQEIQFLGDGGRAGVAFEDRGLFWLKGFAGRWRCWPRPPDGSARTLSRS